MSKIVLFENKEDCCGCEACVNACPKQAIQMQEDEYGFRYPVIDEEHCVECGKCQTVCAYKTVEETNAPLDTYVACTLNTDIMKSASGGIFASLATSFLEQGGVVYGVSMECMEGQPVPVHICVEKPEDIIKLQGSKYVQSLVGDCYGRIKRQLGEGKKVLFSGTPCQVAGLKEFLGRPKDENLLLVDIICHGVPSVQFFQSYIRELSKKIKGTITDFKFRDKATGWGLVGKAEYVTEKGKKKYKTIYARESSYYQFFLKGDIYRENCYKCKYASAHRPGDITLGDYWGIEKEHPEYLTANGGCYDETKGVSCVIVNTAKGKNYMDSLPDTMLRKESTYEKAAKQNGQLRHPTQQSPRRELLLKMYANDGYKAVDAWFVKKNRMKLAIAFVVDRMPVSLKKKMRRMLKGIIK